MAENILEKTRCYLSGPMDFVGSRVIEKYLGWRAILSPVLHAFSIRVLDPWNKPAIRGHGDYGKEGVLPNKEVYEEDFWTNPETRVRFERDFWETVHLDLRMTDLSDFVVAFVPTNIYSVGTVHEIIVARQQFKPVLLISPPVRFSHFPELEHLTPEVRQALKFVGLRENPQGIPSQWYGNIVGGRNMFDGFGWEAMNLQNPHFYRDLFAQVIADAKPKNEGGSEYHRWQMVKLWAQKIPALQTLQGGILDHLKFPDVKEERLFLQAYEQYGESQRQYFWHNQAYTPQRSFLYQFLCIASGQIPPKLNIFTQMNENGQVVPLLQESVDDDWLLISPDLDPT